MPLTCFTNSIALQDVLDEGLGEELFFRMAKQIVELLYKVATNEGVSASGYMQCSLVNSTV